jgi:hypothetical protein
MEPGQGAPRHHLRTPSTSRCSLAIFEFYLADFGRLERAHPPPAGRGKRPPTEAALLFLLGMKRGFLCLNPRYQLFDPIKGGLIGDPVRQALVMLDLAVEFDALVTHSNPARIVKRSNLSLVA